MIYFFSWVSLYSLDSAVIYILKAGPTFPTSIAWTPPEESILLPQKISGSQ